MYPVRVAVTSEDYLTPTAIALGNFDGVHLGHQQVIQSLFSNYSECLQTSVVTFSPHPQEFFTGQRRSLLTPLKEKEHCLQELGIKQLILLPFNEIIAQLSPLEFVEQVLVQQLGAQAISVGFDFGFGQGRSGTATDLRAIAAQFGIPVTIVPPYCLEGERVSSSAIREALSHGEVHRARRLLGRPYRLTGVVQSGQQLGRELGFPTANLLLPLDKFLPHWGVYSVWVESPALDQPQVGVLNIGIRPTVGTPTLTAEVHLLDWQGDLYHQPLTLHLWEFLRPEQRFASLGDLQQQIARDCDRTRQLLTSLV